MMNIKPIELNITGFGPFPGVPKNPTSLVINDLKSTWNDNELFKISSFHLLDVSAKRTAKFLENIHKLFSDISQHRSINIHLGVGISDCYILENQARNRCNFSVPDVDGYQPSHCKIIDAHNYGDILRTSINTDVLCNRMRDLGHNVCTGEDAGEYVCNFTYYTSLFHSSKHGTSSLFIHFPPFGVTSHDQNMKFIKDLLCKI